MQLEDGKCVETNNETLLELVFLFYPIPGDPGAASRDDAIFSGESLHQERKGIGTLLELVR